MSDTELLKTFIDYLKTDLSQIKIDVNDLKRSNTLLQDENELLKKDIIDLKKRLALSEGLNIRLKTKLSQQENDITDLKMRSMRDNIIIKGVDEDTNETWEKTKEKVVSVLKDKLRMPDISPLNIERAHRSGTKSAESRSRAIVAKLSPGVRDSIFGYVKNLEDHPSIKIQEQLPPEVQQKRNKLWPKFIEAKRDKNNRVKWMADKLMINGQLITADEKDVDIDPNTHLNSDITVVHTDHKSENGSTVMAHAASITSQQDISAVLANLFQDRLIASADHNMYAYRIGRSSNLKESFFDDKEHGAGSSLLKLLQEERSSNVIVVVSRWFGGKHLGPRRFELFNETAKEALGSLES